MFITFALETHAAGRLQMKSFNSIDVKVKHN